MISKFLRFGALSGGGWLLDCTLLLLLTALMSFPVHAANFVSSATAALTVFVVSRYLVFSGADAPLAGRVLAYFAYTACVIFLASAAIAGIRGGLVRIAQHFDWSLDPQALTFWAKVVITPPQLVANFLMSRLLNEKRA